jgi:hypothetical protein
MSPPIPDSNLPLIRFLTTQVKLDRDLILLLNEAASDTEKRILRAGSVIRQQQLAIVMRDLRRIQQELWVAGVGPAITSRLDEAEAGAKLAARGLDTYLMNAVGRNTAQALITAFENTVQRGLQLDALRIPSALSTRVYSNASLASGRIERIIRSGIIRQLSAREIANQIKPLIKPNTPGGVSYAAMRLGRTELNNTFHQSQLREAERPWVNGVKWNRSKSHPKKDICDVYADHDEGMGKGIWSKVTVPGKPHPQCLCYMTYDVMDPDQALNLILGLTA